MDAIEHFLCTTNISYVKIENEIHCSGLILRFYSFKSYREGTLSLDVQMYLKDSPSMEILKIRTRSTRNSEFLYLSTFEGTKKEKIKKINRAIC